MSAALQNHTTKNIRQCKTAGHRLVTPKSGDLGNHPAASHKASSPSYMAEKPEMINIQGNYYVIWSQMEGKGRTSEGLEYDVLGGKKAYITQLNSTPK